MRITTLTFGDPAPTALLILVCLSATLGCDGGVRGPASTGASPPPEASATHAEGSTADSSNHAGQGPSPGVAKQGNEGGAGSADAQPPDASQITPPPTPQDLGAADLIPARIRRLSNPEYNASVSALLAADLSPADSFAPDARQDGFTVNAAQRVDPVLAKQLFASTEKIAQEARQRLEELAPCDTPAAPEPCAKAFITSFGARAYRRPNTQEESEGLLEVYRVGAEQDGYGGGIELVIRAVLQSAGFLYVTELGNGSDPEEGMLPLGAYELASALSYLMTGGPPDQALLEAAAAGALSTVEGRVAQMQRLQGSPENQRRLVRAVREWLELDRIESTAKDSTVYPAFDGLKDAMVAESRDFVRAVLEDNGDASASDVEELLGADWTIAEANLGQLYPNSSDLGSGRRGLRARRGVLNQGAFLAVQAHAHESTPVLRGVLIARRLVCMDIPSPSTLNIDVVPPVPDPTQTTRQRFAVHTADPGCAGCHTTIDGFGNAFEQFDGMGMLRTTENGHDVETTTTIAVNNDLDGDYIDSNALAEALSQSPTVRECFARHIFRSVAARSGPSAAAAETAFLTEWRTLPAVQQGNGLDTLEAFISSPLFTHRRSTP